MRRLVDAGEHFAFFLFLLFSQVASVANLPSAHCCERFSLGASWEP